MNAIEVVQERTSPQHNPVILVDQKKIAIVGSRRYPKLDQVRRFVRGLALGTVVVSGGADGVDEVAAEEARAAGLVVVLFLPDYALHGRRAPLVRNDEIVAACDGLVAFWDGESNGTRYAFTAASRAGKLIEVIRPPADA